MKIRFLDLRKDLGLLSEVLQQVFDGKNAPCVKQVDNQLSDFETVVVSSEPIDHRTAQWIYYNYRYRFCNSNPYHVVVDIARP